MSAERLYPRFAQASLAEALTDTPVVLIHGPRQCGKTTLAPMPTARTGRQALAHGSKLYAIGGSVANNAINYKNVEVFDLATGQWNTVAPMPTARSNFGAAVVNGRIHAVGGGFLNTPALKTHEIYDVATDSWSFSEDMPTGRQGMGFTLVDGALLSIGGIFTASGTHSTVVEQYSF
jgi:N-acetylneuraminic acid mutarotase